MDNLYLQELNLDMGKKEYEMYQDIPACESGSTNDFYGKAYSEFKHYLQKEISRKNNEVTDEDTPTTTFILYRSDYPIGIICLRTKLNDNWMKWSGNFYYRLRKSERGKGYGNIILKLAISEFKKMSFNEIYGQSSKGNIASSKVIENNGGILIDEIDGTKYYKIIL